MTHKVYVVTDLGVGDGGKGGVVHRVATMQRAHTIIKRGGAQGSHGVRTSRGETFAFSQWGCATFEGIPTHLSNQMVVSPEGLLNEADALRYDGGIYDPFSMLSVDEEALCATPFDGIASRIKELALGDTPRGTVGSGVGQAYRRYRVDPSSAILVRDLRGSELRDKLAFNRLLVQNELQYIIEYEYDPEDRATLAEEVRLLYDDGFLDYVVERFEQAAQLARIVPHDYLAGAILGQEGVAVVETSHGVLSDREVGFHPHTSALRTLPRFTQGIFDECGYDGQVVNLGITRAYGIRHGAGPMPTDDPNMAEQLLPGSHKDENRYQGRVRVGALDLVLLRYALAACGGAAAYDGLAITWFDQLVENGSWPVCHRYRQGAEDLEFFTPDGDIRLGGSQEHQAALAQALQACEPEVVSAPIDDSVSMDELYALCARTFEEALEVPVRMVSFGPTEEHKLCK
ncbi:adenylosuccinate synthetase [Candidatus Saccharibacteria bacterium]|nr:adenylosuccinate synthetase [Candidatus Saccharibacteria bacterium]